MDGFYYLIILISFYSFSFFFNDTATTEIYTLSLHDALPICARRAPGRDRRAAPLLRRPPRRGGQARRAPAPRPLREHPEASARPRDRPGDWRHVPRLPPEHPPAARGDPRAGQLDRDLPQLPPHHLLRRGGQPAGAEPGLGAARGEARPGRAPAVHRRERGSPANAEAVRRLRPEHARQAHRRGGRPGRGAGEREEPDRKST